MYKPYFYPLHAVKLPDFSIFSRMCKTGMILAPSNVEKLLVHITLTLHPQSSHIVIHTQETIFFQLS